MRRSRQNDSHGIPVVTQRSSWKNYIFDADSILKKKNALEFGNSLRMMKQEDISPCYFSKGGNSGVILVTLH